MRTLPLVILAALALSGCDTMMEKRGYVKNRYGDWIKPGQRYFGDVAEAHQRYYEQTGKRHPDSYEGRKEEYERIIAKHGPPPPGFFPPDPIVINTPAPAPAPSSPQPVIVVGPGGGTTVATQVGGVTAVSSFGQYRPIYSPPLVFPNTAGRPIYYTEPIEQ